MLARELMLEAVDLLIFPLKLLNHAVAIPGDFQPKLHFAGHLLKHIFERGMD